MHTQANTCACHTMSMHTHMRDNINTIFPKANGPRRDCGRLERSTLGIDSAVIPRALFGAPPPPPTRATTGPAPTNPLGTTTLVGYIAPLIACACARVPGWRWNSQHCVWCPLKRSSQTSGARPRDPDALHPRAQTKRALRCCNNTIGAGGPDLRNGRTTSCGAICHALTIIAPRRPLPLSVLVGGSTPRGWICRLTLTYCRVGAFGL